MAKHADAITADRRLGRGWGDKRECGRVGGAGCLCGIGWPDVAKRGGRMMDIKTVLIGCGLVFLLWSCGGVNAQQVSTNAPPLSTTVDVKACYDAALATVRDQWPALSQLQRAALGAQAIQICEGGQQP